MQTMRKAFLLDSTVHWLSIPMILWNQNCSPPIPDFFCQGLRNPPATAEELQVIRFTGAVSPAPSVCHATAWTAAAACFEFLPAS